MSLAIPLKRIDRQRPSRVIAPILSKRELTILHLIAYELTDKEIGQQINLSHHTIKGYRQGMLAKFQVRKSVGLIRKAYDLGILKTRD